MQRPVSVLLPECHVRLPLCEATADLLLDVLLEVDSLAVRIELLGAALEIDPPLATWLLLLATHEPDIASGGVAALARWAAQSLPDRQELCRGLVPLEAVDPDWGALADAVGESVRWRDSHESIDPSHTTPAWILSTQGTDADRDRIHRVWQRFAEESHLQLSGHEVASRDRLARERFIQSPGSSSARLLALAQRHVRIEDDHASRLQSEKLEAMAELAAGAGHEINNPLTVISGRVQLFLQHEQDPERRRSLAVINSQALRVSEMISNMMLFARPPDPRPQRLDVVALVAEVVHSLQPQVTRRRAKIDSRVEGGPHWIEADPNQLVVALRALCENALEATGFAARIELRVEADTEESQVAITVCDDGPGIAPEVHRHLFDPFYSGRQAGRGLGLGLSKCWRIVTNHGGRIEVSSELGRGSRFRMILPRQFSAAGSGSHAAA